MTRRRRVLLILAVAAAGGAATSVALRDGGPRGQAPEASWPPGPEDCPMPDWYRGPIRPDSGCVTAILADTAFHWQHAESPHFALHYTPASKVAQNPARYAARAEQALTDNLALLGVASYAHRIHLFFTSTREESRRAVGGSGTGFTVSQAQTIVLLATPGEAEPADRHEIMHVVSLNVWGVNPIRDYWLREGLAVYATEREAPGIIDSTARAMLADGRARPLVAYRESFFSPDGNNLAAYMLSGSFVKFLLERWGRERLQRMWEGGTDAMERVYGMSAEGLETEWRRSLASRAAEVPGVR